MKIIGVLSTTIVLFVLIVLVNSKSIKIIQDKNIDEYNVFGNLKVSDTIVLQSWDILAPFPVSDREYASDVLDAFGGITGIPRADKSTYPTDLTDDGRAGWTHVVAPGGVVSINYNETIGGVNWPLIEGWAGETASFFGGWGLSDFTVPEENGDMIAILQCQGIDKFFLDDHIMQGDAYGLGIAYSSANVQPGNHTVRVRIMGSEGFQYQCSVQLLDSSSQQPFILVNDVIVPDVVDGQFVSPYVSITVLNLLNNSIDIESVSIGSPFSLDLIPAAPLAIGQIIPINMFIDSSDSVECEAGADGFGLLSLPIALNTGLGSQVPFTLNFTCKTFGNAFTFTFLDFDDSVQYAAAIPPLIPSENGDSMPVLFTLHGAGVDAKSTAWTGAYNRQNNSWILLPTNRRQYGWDWEGPGAKNAWSALNYLTTQLPSVPSQQKNQYGADATRLMYAGHSMGGHGCWLISTHYPDFALSVAVAAGWIDYQTYLPSFLRLGDSWTDPFVRFILDASISEHNVDLYTPHLQGIPLLARFGTDDNNVPPYHLRRMVRLVDEISRNTSAANISAIPGEGHWFNGVVDDAIMQSFFNAHVLSSIPALPQSFTVLTLNPASSGSKGGIQILQLGQPYRVAKLRVTQTTSKQWTISSQNVRRFGFVPFGEQPTTILIDGVQLNYVQYPNSHYCNKNNNGKWQICSFADDHWLDSERQPATYGPLVQVLSTAPLLLVYGTKGTSIPVSLAYEYAVYLSNSLYYQDRFAINVIADSDFDDSYLEQYNVILLGGPATNSVAMQFISVFPIQYNTKTQYNGFSVGPYQFNQPDTGIVFLSPCSTEPNIKYIRQGCLLAVIDGTDSSGFIKAINMFPLKSAISIPDFAVAGPNYGYSGSAGLQALGFYNNFWQFDPTNSYVSYIQN